MDNNEIRENELPSADKNEDIRPNREPHRNYVIYTVVSVLIFFALYFAWNGIKKLAVRDFTQKISFESITDAQRSNAEVFTEISLSPDFARLVRTDGSTEITVVYDNIGDPDGFIEESVGFALSDPENGVRTEIYPDGGDVKEYAFADKYVNVENPSGTLYIYERDGVFCAEYRSQKITEEAAALFSSAEKIYAE